MSIWKHREHRIMQFSNPFWQINKPEYFYEEAVSILQNIISELQNFLKSIFENLNYFDFTHFFFYQRKNCIKFPTLRLDGFFGKNYCANYKNLI